MICASIIEPTFKGAVKLAVRTECDLVEIRFDCLKGSYDVSDLKRVNKPVIGTCMPKWEGGRFIGSEEERISTLFSILPFCDYITIELRTEKRLRDKLVKEAKKKKTKVIISYHDFKKTPKKKEIMNIIRKQEAAGADITKVAFKAKSYSDALRAMEILAEKKTTTPIIAISMGEYGKVTRVLGPLLGSYLTYAAPKKGKESAPGQLTVNEMRKIQKTLKKR
jgi:3-dehydroquinate dehydratase-1